jgi:hypothetical protein
MEHVVNKLYIKKKTTVSSHNSATAVTDYTNSQSILSPQTIILGPTQSDSGAQQL